MSGAAAPRISATVRLRRAIAREKSISRAISGDAAGERGGEIGVEWCAAAAREERGPPPSTSDASAERAGCFTEPVGASPSVPGASPSPPAAWVEGGGCFAEPADAPPRLPSRCRERADGDDARRRRRPSARGVSSHANARARVAQVSGEQRFSLAIPPPRPYSESVFDLGDIFRR
jgi:hypothetical protein